MNLCAKTKVRGLRPERSIDYCAPSALLRPWPVLPGRAPSFLCLPKERKQRKGTPNKLALTGALAAVFSSGRDENSLRSDIRPGKLLMKTPSFGALEGGGSADLVV